MPISLLTEGGCVDDCIMTKRHISVSVIFSLGDVRKWFLRFKICIKTNKRSKETISLILPTLLKGEALCHRWNCHKMFKKIMTLQNYTSLLG